jgi:hypothetical protein
MLRFFSLLLALSTALAGCTRGAAPEREPPVVIDPVATGPSRSTYAAKGEMRPGQIVQLPAEAGGPGRLSERIYVNGWRQSIALDKTRIAGDWNDLSIDVEVEAPGPRAGNIPMGKPTKEGVRHEILARFPKTPMRIVSRPKSNAFGPFGLAIGVGPDGVRCAFAWQWVEDLRAAVRGSNAFFAARAVPASLRLRLCRPGATADQLAEWFTHLQISDAVAIDTIVDAVQHNAANIAAMSKDEIIGPSSLESMLVEASPSKPRSKIALSATRRRQAQHPTTHRWEAPGPLTRMSAAVSSGAGQPQYLAPVTGVSAPASSSQSVRTAGFGAAPFDPGLPVQAYRGPITATASDVFPKASDGQRPHYLGESVK